MDTDTQNSELEVDDITKVIETLELGTDKPPVTPLSKPGKRALQEVTPVSGPLALAKDPPNQKLTHKKKKQRRNTK